MSQAPGTFRWWGAGQGPSGATGLIVAFVVGAIFALVPTYYYMGREAGLRGGAARDSAFDSPVETPRASPGPPSRNASKPFASRMTYELSQLPQERFPPPPKALPIVAPVAPVAVAPAPVARPPVIASPPLPPAEALPAERVANARPISALPPDPRDRTREIEKEREKAEYREPVRPAKAAPPPPVGRVIEGREVELKPRLPELPTRPIVAGSGVDTRAEIEAERNTRAIETPAPRNAAVARDAVKKSSETSAAAARDPARKSTEASALAAKKTPEAPSAVTPGPQVAGVSPITPPPQMLALSEAPPGKASASGSTAAATAAAPAPAASSDVKGRLDVTREWLAVAPQTTHTIQLMGTNSEEQLKGHLQSLSKVLDPTKLYIFRTMAQGKPSITVVYGAYADRQNALQALEKLPASISANRPVLRTVNGIRTEMKQHKTAGDEVKK